MRRKTGRKSCDNWLVIVIDVNLLLEPDKKHDEKEEPFPGQNYWIMDRRRLLIKIPKWKCSFRSHRRHNLWNPFEEKIRARHVSFWTTLKRWISNSLEEPPFEGKQSNLWHLWKSRFSNQQVFGESRNTWIQSLFNKHCLFIAWLHLHWQT